MEFFFVSDFFVFLMLPMTIYFFFTRGWPLWRAFGVSEFVYVVYLHVIWRGLLGGYPLFGGLLVAHIWAAVDTLIPWHDHQPRVVYGGHSEAEVDCLVIVYSSLVLCVVPTILLWTVEKYIRPKFCNVRTPVDKGM